MKFIVTPTYTDIYGSPPPRELDLISGYSTEMMINLAAMINSQLYLNDSSLSNQKNILSFLLRRQQKAYQKKIFTALNRLEAKRSHSEPIHNNLNIFTRHYLLNFISFLYHNSNNIIHRDEDTSFELNFFEAYLCHVQKITSGFKTTEDGSDQFCWFRKNIWPSLVSQIHSNTFLKPFDSFVKGLIFLNYLINHSEYKEITKDFLKSLNMDSPKQYSFKIIQAVSPAWKKTNGHDFKQCVLNYDNPLFKGLALPKKPSDEYLTMDFYSLIKSKPLIQYTDHSFIVLDWDFLVNKLYDGLIYDFYFNSKISTLKKFPSFLYFKRFTSIEITEKQTLKKIVKSIFTKTSFVAFDEGKGGPDSYVRIGKYIFIFEIKDAYFASKAVLSKEHQAIKEEIDKKYNTKKIGDKKNKGVWQLLNSIKQCKADSLEEKTFKEQGLKHRNLVIYPVLIYTDKTFSTPGIGQYLIEEFDKGIEMLSLQNTFQQIKTLSFIHVDFFLENLNILSRKETSLKFFIDSYIKRRKKLLKNLNH